MDEDQFQILMEAITIQTQLLDRLVAAVESRSPVPSYMRPLAEFARFDWSGIDATVVQTDDDGVAVIGWRGQRYTRRSPSNKYDAAIWFSRPVGKNEDGTTLYERLIIFKDTTEPEPLPVKVKRAAYQ